ncbi:MAG: transmembrane anchor protein [Pseudomonadota bacterium]
MYNSEKPAPEELPSTAQLVRSTIIALIAAIAILVTIVLPAEYAVDPTGAGRALGLTSMGEIKNELAREAAEDEKKHGGPQSSAFDWLFEVLVPSAHAQDAWKDQVTFTLKPGASAEIKLVMAEGASAEYEWSGKGGRVNFDLHAHGGGKSHTYEKGRGKTEGAGTMTAPFAGEHGWFWRNRDKQDITVTLRIRGDYTELKQTN